MRRKHPKRKAIPPIRVENFKLNEMHEISLVPSTHNQYRFEKCPKTKFIEQNDWRKKQLINYRNVASRRSSKNGHYATHNKIIINRNIKQSILCVLNSPMKFFIIYYFVGKYCNCNCCCYCGRCVHLPVACRYVWNVFY